MIIRNRPLLKLFAQPGKCEWCNRYCRKREAHHLRTRTPELTIRINLFSVGSTLLFACHCHADLHNGLIPRSEVLSRVALREKCRAEDITDVMNLLRRLIRPTAKELQAGLDELGPSARLLAERSLAERKDKICRN